jgi:hypothetical protein
MYSSPILVIILPTRFIGGKPGQYNEITGKNLIMVRCQLETLTLDIDLWVFNCNLIEVVTKAGLTVT